MSDTVVGKFLKKFESREVDVQIQLANEIHDNSELDAVLESINKNGVNLVDISAGKYPSSSFTATMTEGKISNIKKIQMGSKSS